MFITIDGVDGAGKTSLIQNVKKYIEDKGYSCITTREPGGSSFAESLRSLVLNTPTTPLAETYVFAAARADHCANVLIPHMMAGDWVICDRFNASTYVYQVCEKHVDEMVYNTMYSSIRDLFVKQGLPGKASLEFILDCDFETSKSRLHSRGEKLNLLDTVDREIFDDRRQFYLEYVKGTPEALVIDANGSPENTLQQVVYHIAQAIRNFESNISADYRYINPVQL